MQSVTDAAPSAAPPAVVVPAGPLLVDAAAWIGHACWVELRLHGALTAWLADEADDALAAELWVQRADAAARAEAWHHRLPELRELPRAGFVLAPSTAAETTLDDLEAQPGAGRRAALAGLLRSLRAAYEDRSPVLVGPADGPAAATLDEAAGSVEASAAALGAADDGRWTLDL